MLTVGDLLLSVGVGAYDADLPPLPHVSEEVRIVREAFADAGFVAEEPLAGRCTAGDVEAYLRRGASSRRLVVYWTGHGVMSGDRGWLVTSESTPDDRRPGLGAEQLAEILSGLEGPAQILVILDCCGSGTVARQIAEAVATGRRLRPNSGRAAAGIALVSTSYGDDPAVPMRFAEALAKALRLGPPGVPWPAQQETVPPQALADAADRWLAREPGMQRVLATGIDAGTPFVPNPRHDAAGRDVVVDGALAVRRDSILDVLHAWIASTDQGLLQLTGAMGSGKSSLLAVLAHELTGAGGDVALVDLGRTGSVEAVAAELADRLRLPPAPERASPERLVEAARLLARPAAVLLDALDEADPADAAGLLTRLVLPLARVTAVRLVIAVRGWQTGGDLTPLRSATAVDVDLDADDRAAADIGRLVETLLRSGRGSPYEREPELARAVARQVAERSRGSFLLAETAGRALARGADIVAPDEPALEALLSRRLDGAITSDLARLGTGRASAARAALAALSWAHGAGMPRDAWAAVAAALDPGEPGAAGFDRVVADAGAYVTTSHVDGEQLHRLRHRGFVEFFRAATPYDPVEVARRVCAALAPAPGRWQEAGAYVRRHLAEHAEEGNLLEDVLDAEALPYVDPRTTLPVVDRAVVADVSLLGLYREAGALLLDAPPGIRRFVLASAEQGRRQGIRPSLAAGPTQCRLLWRTGASTDPGRLLCAGLDGPESLAVVLGNGRWLVAAGARDGVMLIDPTTSGTPAPLRSVRGKEVAALAVAPVDGRAPVLAVAYRNQVLEAWDVDARRPLWTVDTGVVIGLSIVRSNGRFALATTGRGPVTLHAPATGRVLGTVPVGDNPHLAVGFTANGRDVLCTSTGTGELEFWHADRPQSLGTVEPDEPWAAAAVPAASPPVLAGVRIDGRLELRRPVDGRLLGLSRRAMDDPAEWVVPFGSSVVTADGSAAVRWTVGLPPDVELVFRGHSDDVTAAARLPGDEHRPVRLVTTSRDGCVRLWHDPDYRMFGGSGPEPHHWRVIPAGGPGEGELLCETSDGYVLLDALSGRELRSYPHRMVRADMGGITREPRVEDVVTLGGSERLAVTAHDDEGLHLWNLRGQEPATVRTPRHGQRPATVVVRPDTGPPLLAVGGGDAPVDVLDFAGRPLSVLTDSAGAEPVAAVDGAPLVVVATTRGDRRALSVHDVRTGALVATRTLGARRAWHAGTTVLAAGWDDGRVAVAFVADTGVRLWRVPGDDVALPLAGRLYPRGTTLVAGGRRLVAVSAGHRVLLVRPADGAVVFEIPLPGQVWGLCTPAPDLLVAVVGSQVHTLRIAPSRD